jgi:mono/diheme cytochrome c family protein
MTAITRVARTSEASEPRERSGDRGVPASERVGGAGGAKPPGQRMQGVRWYVLLAAGVPMLTIGLPLDARQERDAGGFKAPTAALERGRAVYVLNHCHFCHGVDLTRATMGAANLSQSPLVGADDDGNMIGPLVKAGLPNLQTAMPSYAELTSEEIVDLARYVHFLRQQARFRELSRLADTPAGDRTTGEAYFNGAANCRSCHSVTGDLASIGVKYDTATLRVRLLSPGPTMPSEGVSPTAGQAAHLKLLENYTAANVQDLVAYLRASR